MRYWLGTTHISYDAANRLVSARRGEDVREYAYDSLGNAVSVLSGGIRSARRFNALNQLVALDDGLGGEREYRYDGRGNLAAVSSAGEGVEE